MGENNNVAETSEPSVVHDVDRVTTAQSQSPSVVSNQSVSVFNSSPVERPYLPSLTVSDEEPYDVRHPSVFDEGSMCDSEEEP